MDYMFAYITGTCTFGCFWHYRGAKTLNTFSYLISFTFSYFDIMHQLAAFYNNYTLSAVSLFSDWVQKQP